MFQRGGTNPRRFRPHRDAAGPSYLVRWKAPPALRYRVHIDMRIVHRIGRVIEGGLTAAVTKTVALMSRAIDGTIGLVAGLSDRLDARLANLARESRARHRRESRRQIDPITLK